MNRPGDYFNSRNAWLVNLKLVITLALLVVAWFLWAPSGAVKAVSSSQIHIFEKSYTDNRNNRISQLEIALDITGAISATVRYRVSTSSTCNSSLNWLTAPELQLSNRVSGSPGYIAYGSGRSGTINLSSSSHSGRTFCFRIKGSRITTVGTIPITVAYTYYNKHKIQGLPQIVLTNTNNGSNPGFGTVRANDFGDVTGTRLYFGVRNGAGKTNGANNHYEAGLQTGHSGYLEGTNYSSNLWPQTWGYKQFNSDPGSCGGSGYSTTGMSRNSENGWNSVKVGTNGLDTSKWYCFRVKNTVNQMDYEKIGPASSGNNQGPTFQFLRATNARVGLFIDPKGRSMTIQAVYFKKSSTCNSSVTGLTRVTPQDVPSSLQSAFGSGTKVAWVNLTSANGFNLNSTTNPRVCVKVLMNYNGSNRPTDYQPHTVPGKPSIVVTTRVPSWSDDPPESPRVTPINSFADLGGASKIYISASNLNGGSNRREVSLQSGHNGLLGASYSGTQRFANTWGYRSYSSEPSSCPSSSSGYSAITQHNWSAGHNYLNIGSLDTTKWHCFRVVNTVGVAGTKKFGPSTSDNQQPPTNTQKPSFKTLRDTGRRMGLFIDPKGRSMTISSVRFGASTTCNASTSLTASASAQNPSTSLATGFGSGTKVAWASVASFNLSSTTSLSICFKVTGTYNGSSMTQYYSSFVPHKADIAVTTSTPTWPATNTINSFADLAGASKIYLSATNLNGGVNKREVSLQSGHDGKLEGTSYSGTQRFANTWGYRQYGTTEPANCWNTGYTQIPASQRSWTTGANYLNVADLDTTKWYCFQVRNTIGTITNKKFGPIGVGSGSVGTQPRLKILRDGTGSGRLGMFVDPSRVPSNQNIVISSIGYLPTSNCSATNTSTFSSTTLTSNLGSLGQGTAFGTGTKVGWVTLDVTDFGLRQKSVKLICFKLNVQYTIGGNTTTNTIWRSHHVPATPNIVVTLSPPSASADSQFGYPGLSSFDDVAAGTTRLYISANNLSGGISAGRGEISLRSGHNGYLENSGYTGPQRFSDTWGYYKSDTDPGDCSTSVSDYGAITNRDWARKRNIITITDADQEKWFCFRVTNTLGYTGYLKFGPKATSNDDAEFRITRNPGGFFEVIAKKPNPDNSAITITDLKVYKVPRADGNGSISQECTRQGMANNRAINVTSLTNRRTAPMAAVYSQGTAARITKDALGIGSGLNVYYDAMCLKIQVENSTNDFYVKHYIPGRPRIVVRTAPPTVNDVWDFTGIATLDDAQSANRLYLSANNLNGGENRREVSLMSWHNGYLQDHYRGQRWQNTWSYFTRDEKPTDNCLVSSSDSRWLPLDSDSNRDTWQTGNNYIDFNYDTDKELWYCFKVVNTIGTPGFKMFGPEESEDDPCSSDNPPESCVDDPCSSDNPPESCVDDPCSSDNPPESCVDDPCSSDNPPESCVDDPCSSDNPPEGCPKREVGKPGDISDTGGGGVATLTPGGINYAGLLIFVVSVVSGSLVALRVLKRRLRQ